VVKVEMAVKDRMVEKGGKEGTEKTANWADTGETEGLAVTLVSEV
jgi:hypothetical protein